MENKKGKVKSIESTIEVVDEGYENYLDLSVATAVTGGKAVITGWESNPSNKKPVKKTKAVKKITAPTILTIKKAPKPPKRVKRIIREKDFEFPQVRKQNTLRVEKEPLVSMEGDELKDIEALEIKV